MGTLKGYTANHSLKPGATLKFFKPRNVPHAMKESIGKELHRLERDGVLVNVAWSDWASPIVSDLKADGSVRICGDYI